MPTQEFEILNGFLGHGSPKAPIWFIGLEEGKGGDYTPDDFARLSGHTWITPELTEGRESRTLNTLQAIRHAISQGPTSIDGLYLEGSGICNSNLYPLSKKHHDGDFPPRMLESFGFSSPTEYINYVKDTRWHNLRDDWAKAEPRATICYGKGNNLWAEFIELLQLGPAPESGQMLIYESPRVIMTKHFSARPPNGFTSKDLNLIIQKLKEWEISLP